MATQLDKIMARKAVAEQIINMLDNNILNENGFEQFEGWCEVYEKGNIFMNYGVFEHYNKEIQKECIDLMRKVKAKIDDIAWELAPENVEED